MKLNSSSETLNVEMKSESAVNSIEKSLLLLNQTIFDFSHNHLINQTND